MMDWTDRHCRYFHRLLTRHALLYTEMVTAAAVLQGERSRLLARAPGEHPVALQLGGDDPRQLAAAAVIGVDHGFAEINLNVGCPSGRVQEGRFGACLMKDPARVAAAVAAIRAAVSAPVTVKHRIGVDELDRYEDLLAFVDTVAAAGAEVFVVHARKAWLSGLSPKENRTVPPLRYEDVKRLKRERPGLTIEINGGIASLDDAERLLDEVDGVMVGRAAYHDPYLLAAADRRIFGDLAATSPTRRQVLEALAPYVERHLAAGGRLHQVTRHLLGLYHGQPGARRWRRHLSEHAGRPGAGMEAIWEALP